MLNIDRQWKTWNRKESINFISTDHPSQCLLNLDVSNERRCETLFLPVFLVLIYHFLMKFSTVSSSLWEVLTVSSDMSACSYRQLPPLPSEEQERCSSTLKYKNKERFRGRLLTETCQLNSRESYQCIASFPIWMKYLWDINNTGPHPS